MDSCSELPLCSGVTGSNCISMSSSWFIVHVCYFSVFDVVLLVCSRFVGICFFDMAILHFSLIIFVDRASVGNFVLRGLP